MSVKTTSLFCNNTKSVLSLHCQKALLVVFDKKNTINLRTGLKQAEMLPVSWAGPVTDQYTEMAPVGRVRI